MITPYKNRMFDLDREEPVHVYRNTTKKGVVYSIKQGGYVVAHADELYLVNAEFIVKQKGRKKVRKTGKKNVHAWVRGEIAHFVMPDKFDARRVFQVKYDPKKYKTFIRVDNKKEVTEGRSVLLNKKGVFVNNSVQM